MNIKNIILTLFLGLPFFVFSQDVIYTIGGDELKSKVIEILDNDIKYRKFDFLDGPIYSMSKSKIYMIIYKNGQKEKFVVAPQDPKVEKTETEQVAPPKQKTSNNKKPKPKVAEEPTEQTNDEETPVGTPVQKPKNGKKALVEKSEPDSKSPKSDDENSVETSIKTGQSTQTILAKPSKSANASITEQTILDKPKTKNAIAANKKIEKETAEEPAESESIMQKNSGEVDSNYRRSSLYTMMITNPTRQNEEDIKSYFVDKLTPDKYNNHNLDERFISASAEKSELDNIVEHLNRNKIAHQLISKWFSRSPKGDFNMKMIKNRGYYDASVMNIKKAQNSVKGNAILAQAGEELVGNTFILINDSKYINKEDVGKVANGAITMLSNRLGLLGSLVAKTAVQTMAKGYIVSTSSHLFKLVWDAETQQRFYDELYFDASEMTPANKAEIERKIAAFDNADFFALDYIGTDKSSADVQSTAFTTKTNGELIGRATIKTIDNIISKLQAEYDVFKTKTPIFEGDPLSAKIGLKEGVTAKTKFEVLEKQLGEDGTTSYVKVGLVKVDSNYSIWDNRYGADEENKSQETDRTYFKPISGSEFFPGQLLRQLK